MKYEVKFTTQFKRDLKLAKRQGKNVDKLFEVINTIAEDKELSPKYRDHNLSGEYAGWGVPCGTGLVTDI